MLVEGTTLLEEVYHFFHVCFPLGLHIIFSLTLCIVCLNPLCKSLSIIPKGFSLPDPFHYICIILLLFVKRSEHTQLNPKVPESRLDKFEESNSSLIGPLPSSCHAKSKPCCGPNGPTASIFYGS